MRLPQAIFRAMPQPTIFRRNNTKSGTTLAAPPLWICLVVNLIKDLLRSLFRASRCNLPWKSGCRNLQFTACFPQFFITVYLPFCSKVIIVGLNPYPQSDIPFANTPPTFRPQQYKSPFESNAIEKYVDVAIFENFIFCVT